MMEGLRTYYDAKEDILYLAKEGEEQEVVELAPGINVEFDNAGHIVGLEVFKASTVLKDVIALMKERRHAA